MVDIVLEFDQQIERKVVKQAAESPQG